MLGQSQPCQKQLHLVSVQSCPIFRLFTNVCCLLSVTGRQALAVTASGSLSEPSYKRSDTDHDDPEKLNSEMGHYGEHLVLS